LIGEAQEEQKKELLQLPMSRINQPDNEESKLQNSENNTS
jgi:hypothetical protein